MGRFGRCVEENICGGIALGEFSGAVGFIGDESDGVGLVGEGHGSQGGGEEEDGAHLR